MVGLFHSTYKLPICIIETQLAILKELQKNGKRPKIVQRQIAHYHKITTVRISYQLKYHRISQISKL